MDILSFRAHILSLKKASESDMKKWLSQNWNDLPPFPFENEVFLDEIKGLYIYKGHYYKSCSTPYLSNKGLQNIDPLLCVGTSWLYRSDHSEGKPILDKILKGFTLPHGDAPPVFATKMGEYYFCNDGNHRIYTAYLLGISVKVMTDSTYEETDIS